jgi:hypothetical protein
MYLSFKRPIKLKKYFLHCSLKILLVKEENKYVSSASLKTLQVILKIVPKAASEFMFRVSLSLIGRFFPCLSWLSEQLLESQAAL